MAIKDRPKFFQLITLALFSFSLTIILIGAFSRLSGADKERQVYKKAANTNDVHFASSTSYRGLHTQK